MWQFSSEKSRTVASEGPYSTKVQLTEDWGKSNDEKRPQVAEVRRNGQKSQMRHHTETLWQTSSYSTPSNGRGDKMGKFIRITILGLFIVAAGFAPAFAKGGGGHGHGGGGGGGGCVPEIDPGVASSAIALLSCGVLILRSKRK